MTELICPRYVWVNIYVLKSSPRVIYTFANKDAEQAKARQDQRNSDLVFVRAAKVKVW